jgi:hypothetical protein
MKVIVKGQPKSPADGRWNGAVSPEGLTLTRKGRVISIPLGSQAVYSAGNRFAVPFENGFLYLQIARFGYYQDLLAHDLAEWLAGKGEMPNEKDYALDRSLFVLCALPFGIPVLTLGGGLSALLGFGLAVLNFNIAQKESWRKGERILLCFLVALAGYGMVLALWFLGARGVEESQPVSRGTIDTREHYHYQRGRSNETGLVERGYLPTPEDSNTSLLGEIRTEKDVSVREVKLAVRDRVSTMQWSEDGKHLYTFGYDRRLRKISFPGLVEEIVLNTKSIGHEVRWCQGGLLIALETRGQMWLVDPETLEVKSQFHAAESSRDFAFCSSKARPHAYVVNQAQDRFTMINPQNGEVVSTVGYNALYRKYAHIITDWYERAIQGGFVTPEMSPDGKYIFCNGNGRLNRYRVVGDDLVFEESSPQIASFGDAQFSFSDDSRYVVLTTKDGNERPQKPDDYPEEIEDNIFLYKTTDLNYPAFVLDVGRAPSDPPVMAVDPSSGEFYLNCYEKQLVIFDAKGIRKDDYQLNAEESNDNTKQILVHPSGGRMLVLTEEKLFLVERQK